MKGKNTKNEMNMGGLIKAVKNNSVSISRLEKIIENLAIMTAQRFDSLEGKTNSLEGKTNSLEEKVNLNTEIIQNLRHELLDLGEKFILRKEYEQNYKMFRVELIKLKDRVEKLASRR